MCADLIDFPFLRVLFECRVTGPLLYFTPRRGETIKGLIAHEMKKLFPCDFQTPCDKCSVANRQDCLYVRFFRFDLCQAPFSYVIVPPLSQKSIYYHNETVRFEIRLFGECAHPDYIIQYLAPAIEQGGLLAGIGTWYKEEKQHFGRFRLSAIHTWQKDTWNRIFDEANGFTDDPGPVQSFEALYGPNKHDYNRLAFYTPFCLLRGKKAIPEPSVADIIYFSIMRLRSVTGNRKARISEDVMNSLEAVNTLASQFEETFSAKHLNYSIGTLAFESDNELPRELISLLKLGSLCHIGKGTTQGYGGYFLTN
jgi:hypothetical protein